MTFLALFLLSYKALFNKFFGQSPLANVQDLAS